MALTLVTALVALLAMVLGEWWRTGVPGGARDAPIAQATGIALATATTWPGGTDLDGGGATSWLSGLLGPVAIALAATVAVRLATRDSPADLVRDIARCLTSVVVAGVLARIPGPAGGTLLELVEAPGASAGLLALLLLLVAGIAVGIPLVARSMLGAFRDSTHLRERLVEDLRAAGVLPLATASTATVMAISLPILGPVVLILFLVPMAVLLPAVTRQRRLRAAQRQTVVALAGLTDQAGFTAPGHAVRVAGLAVPVAREVGLVDEDLRDVETVALLHDIGQVGLTRPIPGGATTEISLRDQRRVATTGAAILARTAQLSRIAPMVADVGLPQHRAAERGDVSLAGRVVRVVSAYDDITGAGVRLSGTSSPAAALERIVRSTPREFDDVVVRALVRQLERRGDLGAAEAARLRAQLSGVPREVRAAASAPSGLTTRWPEDLGPGGLPPA